MAKPETPTKEKNPKKVAAGKAGGDAKAANKKTAPKPSEKSAKRKNDTPLDYSSDVTDEHVGSQHRRKRNMLESPTERADTSSPSRIPVPKLNVQNGSNKNTYFPHLITGQDHPLPVTIQAKGGQVFRFSHSLNSKKEEDSFWEMLANMATEVREAVGMEAFGATIDSARESLHVEVAKHIYPQLFSTTGQLRYTKANPSELVVAKKHYKQYLTAIAESARELLATAKETLAERENPITTSEFTRSLISTIPRKPQTITEHEHRFQMDAHESALAHASEIIRQELVSVGTIASNYTEEARKASITLTTIYTYVKQLLDSSTVSDTDPPSQIRIKEEPTGEAENHAPKSNPPQDKTAELKDVIASNTIELTASSTSEPTASSASEPTASSASEPIASKDSKPVASKATRRAGLPDFVVKQLLRGHKCLCADCAPNIQQEMYDQA